MAKAARTISPRSRPFAALLANGGMDQRQTELRHLSNRIAGLLPEDSDEARLVVEAAVATAIQMRDNATRESNRPLHADAALLVLGHKIDGADRDLRDLEKAYRRAESAALRKKAGKGATAALAAAEGAMDAAHGRLASLVSEALALPARTLDGVRSRLDRSQHVPQAGDLIAAVTNDLAAMRGSRWMAEAKLEPHEAQAAA